MNKDCPSLCNRYRHETTPKQLQSCLAGKHKRAWHGKDPCKLCYYCTAMLGPYKRRKR